jgi:hypothetical protein
MRRTTLTTRKAMSGAVIRMCSYRSSGRNRQYSRYSPTRPAMMRAIRFSASTSYPPEELCGDDEKDE